MGALVQIFFMAVVSIALQTRVGFWVSILIVSIILVVGAVAIRSMLPAGHALRRYLSFDGAFKLRETASAIAAALLLSYFLGALILYG